MKSENVKSFLEFIYRRKFTYENGYGLYRNFYNYKILYLEHIECPYEQNTFVKRRFLDYLNIKGFDNLENNHER